jgi:hypothetical protein
MPKIESFKDLQVWQRSIEMTVAIYRLTTSFPPDERFGLTSQLRRASMSVASNIAEGYGRGSRGEYSFSEWREGLTRKCRPRFSSQTRWALATEII